jgi:hypothetical protein
MLESSNLNFGLGAIKVDNRSALSNNQRDSWGGATKASDYPSSLWHPATVRGYFDQIDGSGSPNLFNNFYTFNFNEVRDVVAKASGLPNCTDQDRAGTPTSAPRKTPRTCTCSSTRTGIRLPDAHGDRRALREDRRHLDRARAGADRHQLEFAERASLLTGAPTFTTLTGKYHNLLPSVDWDMDLRSDMKVRASYGETIGRPRYDQIAGGQILNSWRVPKAAPATRATRR